MIEDTVTECVPAVYVPMGTAELFDDPRLSSAAVDVVDRLGDRDPGDPGVSINKVWATDRYGKIGPRGKQQLVWSVVKDGLIDRGVVEAGRSYVPGQRAKRYKLTEEWAQKPKVRRPAPISSPRHKGDGARPVPPWARYCLDMAKCDLSRAVYDHMVSYGVDTETARELSLEPDFNAIVSALAKSTDPQTCAVASREMVPLWRWQVDGVTWAFRDERGHRLHTPVTNLPSMWRPYLRFGGKAQSPGLVEIDAVNSQMVFAAALAVDALGTPDARAFADCCGAGLFYETTFSACYGRAPSPAERESWKRKIMGAWLYADIHVQRNSKEAAAVRSLWPSVDRWILERKVSEGESAVPCDMQQREAAIWVDRLIPALAERSIPVWTVHDCAIVPAEHAAIAEAEIRALYAAAGIRATLKTKTL